MAKSKSGYCAAIDKLPWILRLIFSDILFFPFSLDDCLSFIFLQLKYPYISLKRKAEKQATTDMQLKSVFAASAHKIISTTSFAAYPRA